MMSFLTVSRSAILAGLTTAVLSLAGCSERKDARGAEADAANPDQEMLPDTTSAAAPTANTPLQVVAEFKEPQIVGVAVVPDGRVFGVYPRWDDNPVYPIAEVGPNSSLKPYPDASWCKWDQTVKNEPAKHWICPQAATVDRNGMLWVLDPAAPGLKETVPGGPKLVQIDPKTNKVVQTIVFDEQAAPRKSYLNDVRIDNDNNYAYITESAQGGIVVVDLKTQKARRLLTNHPSVKPEDIQPVVEGNKMVDAQGKPMRIASDGIALSRDNKHLYYQALTGRTLYRIPTAALRDAGLSEAQLGQQVENLGKTVATDGMEIDPAGNVYLTAFENNALMRRTPDGKLQELVKDPRLQWPDSYFLSPDGTMHVTTSAIHKAPSWNKGVSKKDQPYRIFKMQLPQQ